MDVTEVSTAEQLIALVADRRTDEPQFVVNRSHTTWERFAAGVREADTLVADFCGTLYPKSQWPDLVAQMPPDLAAEDRAQANAFFQTENPTVQQELALLFDSVRRMQRAGITEDSFRGVVGASGCPRHGARAFVESFRFKLIVSFGIKQYIEMWCRFHNIHADIAALSVTFFGPPGQKKITDYDWRSAVVGSNKGFVAQAYCTKLRMDPSRVVAIGDTPIDLSMMHTGNIGILLIPHTDDDAVRKLHRENGIPKMWPNLSAALLSNELDPLVELRKR